MPNTITEGRHAGEFIIDEARSVYARETDHRALRRRRLEAGHVVGRVTLGAATPAAVAGNTGNGTLASAAVGLGAKVGVYRASASSRRPTSASSCRGSGRRHCRRRHRRHASSSAAA